MDFRGNTDANSNPFAKFWTDWTSQMMGMGSAPTQGDPRDAVMRQMRQAFFDAWARSCEEFLGSETFLDTMKRSMDASLAFRQQTNEFLTKALHESQAPARSDTDSILLALHGLEDRLLSRIDEVADRVAELESGSPNEDAAPVRRTSTPGEVSQKPPKSAARKGGPR